MRKRSWFARLLVGGLVASGLLVVQPAPVQAGDCIWAQAYITRENQDPYYVWDGCVYSTDWDWGLGPGAGDDSTGTVPTGMPNGFFVHVKIPVP